ncbi:MAG: Rdx family protein [Acidiferrobacterales bacterium]
MNTVPRVEIEYCTQCGFLLRAAWIAQELLRSFESEVREVALKPGSGGNFIVRLNDDVLFSRRERGRFPEAKEIKILIRDAISSDRRFGHSERTADPGDGAD